MHIPIAVLKAMRPKQWTKNLLVFAALIFAHKIVQSGAVLRVVAIFALFCVLSGTIYLINDIVDLENDRSHPTKRSRPIASGQLPVGVAAVAAAILGPLALACCFFISLKTGCVALAYVGLTVGYSLAFKHLVILDVLALSGGYVLRAVVGAEAIRVQISPWLLMCTLLLALFLTLTKRRQEIEQVQDAAQSTRRILGEYTVPMLDQMISIVTASTLMSYCLYTISDRTVRETGSRDLLFTIPLVIYGIFRYLYLVHRHGQGEAPDKVLLNDAPLLLTVVLYVVAALVVFFMAHGGLGGPLLPPDAGP